VAEVLVFAMLALAFLIGLRCLDIYNAGGPSKYWRGHRRPILFGLWQFGPRHRIEVHARFLENIRKCSPNWGQPVWGNWAGKAYWSFGFDLFAPAPHNYIVQIPYSLGRQKLEVEAIAYNINTSRQIHICITERVGADIRSTLSGVSDGAGKLSLHGFGSDDPRWKRWQAIATEIDAALRDALE
jgi:hypothetical protein